MWGAYHSEQQIIGDLGIKDTKLTSLSLPGWFQPESTSSWCKGSSWPSACVRATGRGGCWLLFSLPKPVICSDHCSLPAGAARTSLQGWTEDVKNGLLG